MSKSKDEQIAKLQEEVEHLKLYFKAWQRAREMINKTKDMTKVEKQAMIDVFNIMTITLNEEVRNGEKRK